MARLRMATPAGRLAEARQRTEDALRLAADAEERLLVVRKLDLGILRVGAPAAQWQDRAATRLRDLGGRAIHGAQPGADTADAVWFRSVEEARTLLLSLLASGRSPTAWFWRLAVRDWQAPPARWLATLLAEAEASPEAMAALARTLTATIAAGHADTLTAWLADIRWPTETSLASSGIPSPTTAPSIAEGAAQARSIFARLPTATIRQFETAVVRASDQTTRQWLARIVLIAAAPELAARRATNIALAEAIIAILSETTALLLAAAVSSPQAHAGRPTDPARVDPPTIRGATEPRARHGRAKPPSRSTDDGIDPPPSVEVEAPYPIIPESIAPFHDRRSTAAGTLLLIRPLWRMGLEEWLDDRPTLAIDGFGRRLLAHIARQMRAPADDPLFALLDTDPDHDAHADALAAWRIGLDRWLRRRAHLRLADIARRPGWLAGEGEGIDVRFPLDAADIRLRRHALDVDPGWVGWLGRVVRYRYRDTPG